jgi:Arc/MetJ-type ribon-helix-helix transcriptional regulator
METLSVRLPAAMVDEIDEYVEELRTELPLLLVSRADGVRQLLALALQARKKEIRRKG